MMIKNRTKFVLIAGIGFSLFSGLSQAMFLKKGAYDRALLITNPSASARLGALALIHDDEQRFSVLRESGEISEIPNHLVAKDLRGISQDEVKARLDNNINFRVQQGSDGEFSVQEGGGLDGGGLMLAKTIFLTVRGIGYTGLGVTIAKASNAAIPGGYQERPAEVLATGAALTTAAVGSGAFAVVDGLAVVAGVAGLLLTPFP